MQGGSNCSFTNYVISHCTGEYKRGNLELSALALQSGVPEVLSLEEDSISAFMSTDSAGHSFIQHFLVIRDLGRYRLFS